jgi:hypothetical protein
MLVSVMRGFITIAVFGTSVPPLLLLVVPYMWLQGSSCTWYFKTAASRGFVPKFAFRVANCVLVQQPVTGIQTSVHILSWIMNGFIVYDLEFTNGTQPCPFCM